MGYQEVQLDLIDSNPFQTRSDFDMKAITGIATSAMDGLGIRNAPLLRPNPKGNGRFQIASGELRIKAWKTLGHEIIFCRVENLTDSQMKKEVLVENINRSDLSEDERFQALEAYRLDPDIEREEDRLNLLNKGSGWIPLLSRLTGVNEVTLRFIYDVKHIREKLLKISSTSQKTKDVSMYLIQQTGGLQEDERVKLVEKAVDRGWSGRTVHNVKTALKEMTPEIRELILDEKTKLPHKVIAALATVPPDLQEATIIHIRTHKYNEDLALSLIERVKSGEPLETDVVVTDEMVQVFKQLERVWTIVSGWGVNQREILKDRWADAVAIFSKIEEKMIDLKVI